MARVVELHPINPQPHRLKKVVNAVCSGGLMVFPTDSCYAMGCQLGDKSAIERMRRLKKLDKHHLYTLICKDLKHLSKFAQVDNWAYRMLKSLTPGPYTFVLRANREVPNRLQTKKRKTIGIRVPDHAVTQMLLELLDAPLLSTTAELPGSDLPLNDAHEINDLWGHGLDYVLDAGSCGIEHTTIIDLSNHSPEVIREGKGPTDAFA